MYILRGCKLYVYLGNAIIRYLRFLEFHVQVFWIEKKMQEEKARNIKNGSNVHDGYAELGVFYLI